MVKKQTRAWTDYLSHRPPWQVALVSFVIAFVALAVAWQSRVPIVVDLGNTSGNIDSLYVSEFHEAEVRSTDASTYRWTGPQSSISFLGIGNATWQITMNLASNRTSSQTVNLTLFGSDGSVAFYTTDKVPGDFGTLSVPVNPPINAKGDLHLVIAASPVLTSTSDERMKGVALNSVTLTPQGPVLPPLGDLFSLSLGIAALVLSVSLVFGSVIGLAAGILPTAAVAWLVGWHRIWLTPFVGQLVLIALLLLLGVLVVLAMLRTYLPQFHVGPLGASDPDYLTASKPTSRTADSTQIALVALLACAIAYAIVQFGFELVVMFDKPRSVDFQARWQSSKGVGLGFPLYDVEGLHKNPFGSLYRYPPIFAGLLRPLTLLDFDTARDLWRGIDLGFMVAAVLVIIYAFSRLPIGQAAPGFVVSPGNTEKPNGLFRNLGDISWASPAALGLIFVTLVFYPLMDSLNYGQLDPLIVLLVGLSFFSLRAGRPELAGIPLALATALKLYPGLLVLYLLWQREWRALISFVVAFVGWGLLGMLLTTPQDTWVYFTQVLPDSGGTTAWIENQTLSGFVARLLTDRFASEPFAADLPARVLKLNVLNYGTAALLFGITLWLARPPINRRGPVYALGFATLFTASIFLLPAAWLHYYVALLLPIGIALYCLQTEAAGWWAQNPRIMTAALICLGLSSVLLIFGNIWLFYDGNNLGGIWKLLLSYKFYGAVALWAGLLMLLSLARADSSNASSSRMV